MNELEFSPPQMRLTIEDAKIIYDKLRVIPENEMGQPTYILLKKCEAYLKNYAPEKL